MIQDQLKKRFPLIQNNIIQQYINKYITRSSKNNDDMIQQYRNKSQTRSSKNNDDMYDQQIGDQMKGDYEIDEIDNFRQTTKRKRSYYMRQDQDQQKSIKRTKMTPEDEFNQFKKIYDQLRKK